MRISKNISYSTQKIIVQTILLLILCYPVYGFDNKLPSLGRQEKTSNEENLKKIGSIRELFIIYKKANDLKNIQALADSLKATINLPISDSIYSADIFYYIGVSETTTGKNKDGIFWLERAKETREKLKILDVKYVYIFNNLALAYGAIGDIDKELEYIHHYINTAAKLPSECSGDVVEGYSFLLGKSFEIKDFRNFILYSQKALDTLKLHPDVIGAIEQLRLYHGIGSGYESMGDYIKGVEYLEKAENIWLKNNLASDEAYVNLLNSLVIGYENTKQSEKKQEYFMKGVAAAKNNPSHLSLNLMNTYAISLGKSGKTAEGDKILKWVVSKAKQIFTDTTREYAEFLGDYASYLRVYMKDNTKAFSLYAEALKYVYNHPEDKYECRTILEGYAETLVASGDLKKAMNVVQSLLFKTYPNPGPEDIYINPPSDSINPDKSSLSLLDLKHSVLLKQFRETREIKNMETAADVSELIISVLDRIRINISEDESRLILGNRSRDFYISAVSDFNTLYQTTGNFKYLEKTFRYAEKSKVAGLLTSMREMNAIQFNIPGKIADLEKDLQNRISYYNLKISLESDKIAPDYDVINGFKNELLSDFSRRDSLIKTFEKDYPDYYTLKYNNDVPSVAEIPSIVGRRNNYLNFVLSDSMVYIFVANRKYTAIETTRIDSGFIKELNIFRSILSDPSRSGGARKNFNDYQEIGYDLFHMLIDPVRKYFISDNLIISPDNLLSYIPFETLITKIDDKNDLQYRDLFYLMNEFNISYSYSATFMKEMAGRRYVKGNGLVAFAPLYPGIINTDSLFAGRQAGNGLLYDLPEARREAQYVSDVTGGKAYLLNDALESEFKKVAGNYDIIHLAMHTWLNDQRPMNSAMIFTLHKDTSEDGLLYTNEVYGLQLKARMVVLSSCNTGNGILFSGEGILSLARGFLYSGCKSVVMSMWAIDDKSGTDIVNMFYDNLLKGESKGKALKTARRSYLKTASQLRSHPYYWSSLVIYGENENLFRNYKPLIISVTTLIIILAVAVFIYLWKRRYS
jgi:CHAT domain-containing protein